ncbi:MAG: lipoyl synthase [Candidatus Kapabacteria bacterium]|nr:lipoyl synthase [Candidatus Kapabacteria bacterium]
MTNISTEKNKSRPERRPEWLKIKTPGGKNFSKIKTMMRSKSLHTVCEAARCPNISECWSCGTATFMVLGDQCSRSCRFCAIKTADPYTPDPDEPSKVAESVKMMKLRHAVITSVTRDDLPDGGSTFWAILIKKVREVNPDTTIEVLIPDFNGEHSDIMKIINANPDILNHNIETVPRIYSKVRPQADYQQSLDLLKLAAEKGMRTKSGIMVGLGEEKAEVIEVMKDLRAVGVKILTIGQYLQPNKELLPVSRFVHPDEFAEYREAGLAMGFEHVESAPLVRSSYHADNHVERKDV